MNALSLPAFFESLGHSQRDLAPGGGSFGRKDGPKQTTTSCRQGAEGCCGRRGSMATAAPPNGVIEDAKTHENIEGVFSTQDGRESLVT